MSIKHTMEETTDLFTHFFCSLLGHMSLKILYRAERLFLIFIFPMGYLWKHAYRGLNIIWPLFNI